jgi:hypothetical protein
MIVNEAPHIMDVLDNYVHCFNGGPGDDGYLIGSHVYKDFPGHGGMMGRVVAFDPSEMWYLVTYTDGDREEMTADEVIEIETTETDSINLWYHDSGQYVYSGKAHAGVIGSLYYIEIPETRYMAGTTGLFLYTGTGYAPSYTFRYMMMAAMLLSIGTKVNSLRERSSYMRSRNIHAEHTETWCHGSSQYRNIVHFTTTY